MTKMQALYSFFSSFGIPAYEENSIYAADVAPLLPYITYGVATASFPASNIPIPATIWYNSTSWKDVEETANAVNSALSNGGYNIACDGGYIHLKRENDREADMQGDPSSKFTKKAILHIIADFNTID